MKITPLLTSLSLIFVIFTSYKVQTPHYFILIFGVLWPVNSYSFRGRSRIAQRPCSITTRRGGRYPSAKKRIRMKRDNGNLARRSIVATRGCELGAATL